MAVATDNRTEKWMTITNAAKHLRISRQTIYNLMRVAQVQKRQHPIYKITYIDANEIKRLRQR